MQTIGQNEMPDYRGIKYIGFKPHLIYDLKGWADTKLSPRAERKEDLDTKSIDSVGFSTESWDRASAKDPND